jgi:competence protein ComEC
MQSEPESTGPLALRSSSGAPTSVPLFHAAWLFATGIVLAHFVWLRPGLLLVSLAPVAVLCCFSALRAQRVIWLPLAVLWFLLGAWCTEMEPQPAPAQPLAALSDGLLRTVEGTVMDAGPLRGELRQNSDDPAATEPAQQIDLRVTSIEVVTDAEDSQSAVQGNVRLTIRWPQQAADLAAVKPFRCGQHIRAVARLFVPQDYRDPGTWSRAGYLLEQGITATGSVSADLVDVFGTPQPASLKCRFATWQHGASTRLLALPGAMRRLPGSLRLDEDDAAMIAAMVTGDRTYLNHSLRAGFERTGSFHMLVVSGLHLSIFAGFLLWVTRKFRVPQIPATLMTIAVSFAYALFTGFATPVQRSLWMVTLYLVGRLVYRERSALNTIGFASLCLLAVSPRSLFESSLQMTLLAVVAISGVAIPLLQNTIHPLLVASTDLSLLAIDVKLAPRLAQYRVEMRMIANAMERAVSQRVGWIFFPWAVRAILRGAELLIVSIAIELAMALPMALYFHRITVLALPVNIFILPLLVVLMPAALLTLFALAVWPVVAVAPAAITAVFLHAGVGLVRLFGSLAWGDFRIPGPLIWQSAVFCVLLGLAIVLARRANASGARWQRLCAWAALVLAAAAAVAPRPIQHPRNSLFVEAIDVGQGDSLLVITPDGKTMLVDGGGFGGAPRQAQQEFDIGEEVVSPTLWSRGIRRLDIVALSHAHSDHMGGLPAVLRNFKPAELWVGNNPRSAAYSALLREATALHVRLRELRAKDELRLGETAVRVLAPSSDYEPGDEANNNDSLVLHVSYADTSVMLEGDAESPIERAMLHEPDLKSTLLKVGHHGSVSSTLPEYLARVTPQWAVVSCGLHNRYGHPREEVLQELQSSKVRTFSTDINGAVCFTLDGKTSAADPFCGRDYAR